MATIDDFQKLNIRVGKIVAVEDFPEAHSPTYKLTIDFGPEVGVKKSAAGLAILYKKEELKGRLVLGVVNFPPRQIGPFSSDVLTRGVSDKEGKCILVVPEKEAPLGAKLY
jgi:tRNA-binding protein